MRCLNKKGFLKRPCNNDVLKIKLKCVRQKGMNRPLVKFRNSLDGGGGGGEVDAFQIRLEEYQNERETFIDSNVYHRDEMLSI